MGWIYIEGAKFANGNPGDIFYLDADKKLAHLPYPSGAALGDYVAVTGDDNHPVWMARTDLATLLGTGSGAYTWAQMTTIDETGATVLMSDDDGTPILTYIPVP